MTAPIYRATIPHEHHQSRPWQAAHRGPQERHSRRSGHSNRTRPDAPARSKAKDDRLYLGAGALPEGYGRMTSEQLQAERDAVRQKVESMSQCSGPVLECPHALRIVKIPNAYQPGRYGPWQFCRYCDRCGRKSTALPSPPENPGLIPVFSKEAAAKISETKKALWLRYSELEKQIQEARKSEWHERRSEYQNSPEWHAKRRAVIKRCGNLCEGCRAAPVDHIHHLSYENFGDELLFQLVGLCFNCHARCHPDKF